MFSKANDPEDDKSGARARYQRLELKITREANYSDKLGKLILKKFGPFFIDIGNILNAAEQKVKNKMPFKIVYDFAKEYLKPYHLYARENSMGIYAFKSRLEKTIEKILNGENAYNLLQEAIGYGKAKYKLFKILKRALKGWPKARYDLIQHAEELMNLAMDLRIDPEILIENAQEQARSYEKEIAKYKNPRIALEEFLKAQEEYQRQKMLNEGCSLSELESCRDHADILAKCIKNELMNPTDVERTYRQYYAIKRKEWEARKCMNKIKNKELREQAHAKIEKYRKMCENYKDQALASATSEEIEMLSKLFKKVDERFSRKAY